MYWNWEKVPEAEHQKLIEAADAFRWSEVAKICEQYEVSGFCCCNQEGLQNWLRWAIEKGIIGNGKPGAALAGDAGRNSSADVGATA